jgi:hypothetical protein
MPIHSKVLEASAKGATPLKAVRQHCVGCCGGNTSEPAYCPSTACALWLFRFGRNPTPEERQAVADNYLYPLERGQTGDDVASRTATKPRNACAKRAGATGRPTKTTSDARSCKKSSRGGSIWNRDGSLGSRGASTCRAGHDRGLT